MYKLKILLIALFTVSSAVVPLAATAATYAQATTSQNKLCAGANLEVPTADGDCENINTEAATGVNDTVNLVINIFSWVVGVVSVIMIIWGGFKYITSGGDAGSVTAAKNTILYAIVGLIIVALAQIIVKFVLGNVTNSSDSSV